jgi:hypothetical protein
MTMYFFIKVLVIGKGVLTESYFVHRIALTNLSDQYLKRSHPFC